MDGSEHGVRSKKLFGIPVGDFGFFATALICSSLCAMAFFGGTFLAIVGVAIYNGISRHPVSMAYSYKYFSAPFAVFVFVAALVYFYGIWFQRKRRG